MAKYSVSLVTPVNGVVLHTESGMMSRDEVAHILREFRDKGWSYAYHPGERLTEGCYVTRHGLFSSEILDSLVAASLSAGNKKIR